MAAGWLLDEVLLDMLRLSVPIDGRCGKLKEWEVFLGESGNGGGGGNSQGGDPGGGERETFSPSASW